MSELLLGIDIGTASSQGRARRGRTARSSPPRRASTRLSLPAARAGPSTTPRRSGGTTSSRSAASCSPTARRRRRRSCVSGIGPCLLPADAAGRAAAAGDPLRHRHPRDARDRRADRALGRGGDPAPLRLGAVQPGASARSCLAAPQRAGGLGARPAGWLMASSLRRRAADRRVRARPPLGQPVRPALRPRRRATGSRTGPTRSRPASSCRACSGRARWSARSRRRPRRRPACPPGTPVVAGTIDAWAEAPSVGVRAPGDLMLMYGTTMFLVAVADEPLRDAPLWGTAGALPGTLLAWRPGWPPPARSPLAARARRRPAFDDLIAEAAAAPARRRRPAGAALLRRRADADLRPRTPAA